MTLFLSMAVTTILCLSTSQPNMPTTPLFQDEEDTTAVDLFSEIAEEGKSDEVLNAEIIESPENASTQTSAIQTEPVMDVLQKTFAIIKPDAVANGSTGEIINLIELNGFTILKMEKKQLTQKEAESFYAVHKDRPFFKDLVHFMTTGPVVVLALEKNNAIRDWRKLMGATNPGRAKVGTLRRMFGHDITHNATHGSDSEENAKIELNFFFPDLIPMKTEVEA